MTLAVAALAEDCGAAAQPSPKHWHVFHVTAQTPTHTCWSEQPVYRGKRYGRLITGLMWLLDHKHSSGSYQTVQPKYLLLIHCFSLFITMECPGVLECLSLLFNIVRINIYKASSYFQSALKYIFPLDSHNRLEIEGASTMSVPICKVRIA